MATSDNRIQFDGEPHAKVPGEPGGSCQPSRKTSVKNEKALKAPLLCDQCSYSTHDLKCIKRHLQRRKPGQLVHCPDCEFTSCSTHGMRLHIKGKHLKAEIIKIFQCKRCSYKSINKCNVEIHEKAYKNSPVLQCTQCDLTFCFPLGLSRHRIQCHSKKEDVSKLILTEPRLKLRVSYTNFYESGIPLPDLEKRGRRRKMKEEPHERLSVKQAEKKLTKIHEIKLENCPKCDFSSSFQNEMAWHLKSHSNKKKIVYKCSHCEFRSMDRISVKQHKKEEHSKKDPSNYCGLCGKDFISEANYEKHKLLHKSCHSRKQILKIKFRESAAKEARICHDNEPVGVIAAAMTDRKDLYCCHFCEYKSYDLRKALDHIRDHEIFKCLSCNFISADELGLKEHEEKHCGA